MNEPERIRVFSVDDHPLLREGITAIVKQSVRHADGGTGSQLQRSPRPVS